MAQTTVKDFAKTLKISEEALLKRMSSAGLSHNSATDEVTTEQNAQTKLDKNITMLSKTNPSIAQAIGKLCLGAPKFQYIRKANQSREAPASG